MFPEDELEDLMDEADLNGDGRIDDKEQWSFFDVLEEEMDAAKRRRSASARPSHRDNAKKRPGITERRGFFSAISLDPDDDDEADYYDEDEFVVMDRDHALDAKLKEYRRRIDEIVNELQKICKKEEEFIQNASEKYEETDRYEQAEDNANYLSDAISELEDASFNLGMASI